MTVQVTLEVIDGINKGKKYRFTEPDTFLVGRAPEAHFNLGNRDLYVSRRHFLLEILPPRCRLFHISKTNETKVNGHLVQECDLSNGDVIEVGYTVISLSIDESLKIRILKCQRCGKDIQILGDASDTECCPDCLLILQSPVHDHKMSIQCLCHQCGKDLSNLGNSDNRAQALDRKVIYLCPECLPPSEFMAGEKIGPYELIEFLAEGGMGDVYKVYHRETARFLVLKQIKGLSDNQLFIKHFEREISVHSCLNHENIIQYIDSGVAQNRPYLVMEYATGGDLNHLLWKLGGTFELEQVIKLTSQLLNSLTYLHNLDNPIVHRDLKPENILLIRENGELLPKITDFGIAKPYAEASGSTLTKIGDKKGTILFMSPEQILNCKDVDHRTDIYAMGLIIYYMLTAKLPYAFPSPFEHFQIKEKYGHDRMKYVHALKKLGYYNNVLDLIIEGDMVPIQEINDNIPPSLAKIIDRALERRIEKRYQKTIDFLHDIENVQS